MLLLMVLVLSSAFGAIAYSIHLSTNALEEETTQRTIEHVESVFNLLNDIEGDSKSKEAFRATARDIINNTQWGKDGYFMLMDKQGNLLAYPADPSRIGRPLKNTQLKNSNEHLVNAIVRIGKSRSVEAIQYDYIKPQSNEMSTKVTAIYPSNSDWILAAGEYLDASEKIKWDIIKQTTIISLIVMLIIIGF